MSRLTPALLSLAFLSAMGCATSSAPNKNDETSAAVAELEQRLQESEQRNKRLDQKLGRLENELAATKDSVEAQKLAAQFATQHQPDPVPESHFSNGLATTQSKRRGRKKLAIPARQEKRIRLGSTGVYYYDEDSQTYEDEEIVMSQEDFERVYGKSSPSNGPSTTIVRTGRRVSQPNVTDERLPVTNSSQQASAPPQAPVARGMNLASQPGHSTPGLADYEQALALYRNGDFDRALQKFKAFNASNTDRAYKDNALYWIGESYFALEQTEKAISLFERVIKEVPEGNKVPNAMLKMGVAYRKLGKEARARATFKRLSKKYGETGAGQIAKRELEK